MLMKYSPEEVLKIAIQVEEHGRAFYEEMASKTNDIKLNGLLTTLAAQEVEHALFFESLLSKQDFFTYDNSFENEYNAYFDAIADEFVFSPTAISDRKKQGFDSDVDVLDFAIGMEKNAVLTYSAMEDYVAEDKKSVLEKIVIEEKRHYALLSALKQELLGSKK